MLRCGPGHQSKGIDTVSFGHSHLKRSTFHLLCWEEARHSDDPTVIDIVVTAREAEITVITPEQVGQFCHPTQRSRSKLDCMSDKGNLRNPGSSGIFPQID